MKIIYCIAATYNSGGMERVLANKANYLVALGHEVCIITTDQKGEKPYFQMEPTIQHIDLGINYLESAQQPLLKKSWNYVRKQRLHKKALQALLFKIKADVVISMFDHEVSFLHAIQDGSKKVLEIHFSRYKRVQYGRKGIIGAIDRYRSKQDLIVAKKYDRFVVLTHEDKGYWGDLANMQVIPNANSFSPAAVASLQQKQAIAVGRYDYQKGFDDLIAAWALVAAKFPDWVLKIYGHGPLKPELEKQIKTLNLQGKVMLCAPTNQIEKAYLESALVLMTSRYEGLPMALLEGQACGLGMISYTCKCGPKDIIVPGKNGFLVAEGDIKGFAEQVIQVLADDSLRVALGQHAKEMSANFSEDKIMQQWIALFNQLVPQKG